MKNNLTLITVLISVSFSFSQTKIVTHFSDNTNRITEFRYHCIGLVGSSKIVVKRLRIERFDQRFNSVSFKFLVTTNCGNSDRGRVITYGDTLEISKNAMKFNYKRTIYIDSLGNKSEEESYEESVEECNCVSRYRYKLKNIKDTINVLCFQDECITLNKR